MTYIIVATATDYFVITQASKKIRKGWWSKDIIKQARTELKEAKRKFKIRQSHSNLSLLQSAKARHQNIINKSKIEGQKT